MKIIKLLLLLAICTFTINNPKVYYVPGPNPNEIVEIIVPHVFDACLFLETIKGGELLSAAKGEVGPSIKTLAKTIMQEEAAIVSTDLINALKFLIDNQDTIPVKIKKNEIKNVTYKEVIANLINNEKWERKKTIDNNFVVLIPKKKYKDIITNDDSFLEHLELNKDILEPVDITKTKIIGNQTIALETLDKLFLDNNTITRRIILVAHGEKTKQIAQTQQTPLQMIPEPTSSIAQMPPQQFAQFLLLLKRIGCSYLQIISCFTAGWNILAAQLQLVQKQTLIIKQFNQLSELIPFITDITGVPDSPTKSNPFFASNLFFTELNNLFQKLKKGAVEQLLVDIMQTTNYLIYRIMEHKEAPLYTREITAKLQLIIKDIQQHFSKKQINKNIITNFSKKIFALKKEILELYRQWYTKGIKQKIIKDRTLVPLLQEIQKEINQLQRDLQEKHMTIDIKETDLTTGKIWEEMIGEQLNLLEKSPWVLQTFAAILPLVCGYSIGSYPSLRLPGLPFFRASKSPITQFITYTTLIQAKGNLIINNYYALLYLTFVNATLTFTKEKLTKIIPMIAGPSRFFINKIILPKQKTKCDANTLFKKLLVSFGYEEDISPRLFFIKEIEIPTEEGIVRCNGVAIKIVSKEKDELDEIWKKQLKKDQDHARLAHCIFMQKGACFHATYLPDITPENDITITGSDSTHYSKNIAQWLEETIPAPQALYEATAGIESERKVKRQILNWLAKEKLSQIKEYEKEFEKQFDVLIQEQKTLQAILLNNLMKKQNITSRIKLEGQQILSEFKHAATFYQFPLIHNLQRIAQKDIKILVAMLKHLDQKEPCKIQYEFDQQLQKIKEQIRQEKPHQTTMIILHKMYHLIESIKTNIDTTRTICNFKQKEIQGILGKKDKNFIKIMQQTIQTQQNLQKKITIHKKSIDTKLFLIKQFTDESIGRLMENAEALYQTYEKAGLLYHFNIELLFPTIHFTVNTLRNFRKALQTKNCHQRQKSMLELSQQGDSIIHTLMEKRKMIEAQTPTNVQRIFENVETLLLETVKNVERTYKKCYPKSKLIK